MAYTPFEMDRMLEEMDAWFDQMRSQFWTPERTGRTWLSGHDIALDVHEEADAFVVVADIPGFEKDEIDLTLQDDSLVISASHEVTGEEYSRSRRVFERMSLPVGASDEDITAHYRNGVLEIHVPKLTDDETGVSIDIED